MHNMDAADFWQQARAPFAHTAVSTLQQQQQQQQQQSQQPQLQQQLHLHPHNVSNQEQHVTPSNNNHLPLQNKLDPHQMQQQQSHQQQQQQPQQQQLLQQHVEHCYGNEVFGSQQTLASAATSTQLSSHHLLFNAAAAAAAAAHLKSTARSNICIEPNAPSATKQQQQQQSQIAKDSQQQPDQAYSSEYFGSTGNPEHLQHQQHHKQQQQEPLQATHPPQSPTLVGQGQGQLPSRPLSQGQQSPQHSITPSGGCSTPDIKYNNEKLASEIQLQLSRSSSAAAISERTLEECWSTLQRLFMHKSAMQQIQQQIPRVGLGVHGVASGASMGGGTTPGAETKPHQCQQCMKSFSSNHQLVQHIRVHTGEKPYKCSYCDRRFKQLSHVQQHTRLHTGERPYKCHLPDCGRAFIQLSNLQQHLRNHDAQVERAKNRPFHCNICGKGFATESSLRTHTSKELQLHLGVLQQHAALIGGPNATSCPVCHKLFLGTEALMDHMKNVHKEKTPPPSASTALPAEPLPSAFSDAIHTSSGSAPCSSELNSANQPSTTTSGSSLNESYLGKRRTANHPCPVCGKHYVNEGSLRKHLACHAETSQLTNSLRMWPCSVCQAVFTHENGLLTHMDHMRMDPKHQFAAQYVLSRAAAEQRERESLLAATLVATSTGNGVRDSTCMLPLGVGSVLTTGGGSNSLCPSPSANSECSSNGRLSSSSTSDQEPDQDQEQDADQGLSENENSSHNNNINNVNNNNNRMNINNNNCSDKLHLSELRLPSSVTSQYSIDAELHANRMSLMAAASAAAAAVAASAGSRSQDSSLTDAVSSGAGNAAVQAAVVNSLAAAMRLNNPNNPHQQQLVTQPLHHQPQSHHHHQHQHQHQQQAQQAQQQQAQNTPQHQQLPHLPLPAHHCNTGTTRRSPNLNVPSLQLPSDTSSVMMSMMRGTLDRSLDSSLVGGIHQIDALHHQHQHVHQTSSYSQNAIVPSSQQNPSHPSQHGHHPDTALRMHQQAEAILRTHKEAAFRLAASVAATNGANAVSTAVKIEMTVPKLNGDIHQVPQHAQSQQEQQTGGGHNS